MLIKMFFQQTKNKLMMEFFNSINLLKILNIKSNINNNNNEINYSFSHDQIIILC